MQLLTIISGLASVHTANAFTNGSLIPPYFCNPNNDGLPKSLGQLLPLTQLDVGLIAFNNDSASNLKTVPVTGGKPGNAGFIIASFHNTINSITPIQQGMVVTLVNGTSLQAGKANLLLLQSLNASVPLVGAMLNARNDAGKPVGSFQDAGNVFVAFPGCGKNSEGVVNGVVHSGIISETATYNTLSYIAPNCGTGNIHIAGLSVTDDGFGVWNYTFPLVGGLPAASCRGTKGNNSTKTAGAAKGNSTAKGTRTEKVVIITQKDYSGGVSVIVEAASD